MKRTLILLSIILSANAVRGQIAEWLIQPVYDNISMSNGEQLIITDSLNSKILWSQSGKRLAITDNLISPFKEGYSVTTSRNSDIITGFFDREGKFKAIQNCNITYSMPYFSNNHLLVHDGTYYRFVDTNGNFSENKYENAYPFFNGYASCSTFADIEKRKDYYNLLLTEDDVQVIFSFNGKQFDDDDLEYISSVNDMNIGIVVAKHKLYFFNGKNKTLSPVFAKKDENNIKNQAKLEGDLKQCFTQKSDNVYVLNAKCGKNDRIQIIFDQYAIPISIIRLDGEYECTKKQEIEVPLKTPLKVVDNRQNYGINWEDMEILPPQFDKVIQCFDDNALVRLNGKCGMLKVYKDENFKISINKDKPIGFKHQKYETTIRLDMPKMVSTSKAWIEVDPNTGCEIDMQSEEKKETSFGNNVQYQCVLTIPESLPDRMYNDETNAERNAISYPTRVFYDGLRSPIIPYKVMAWHWKYFNVDEIESERSVSQGVLSFSFNVNAERSPGEAAYPTTVNIKTVPDTLSCELEKISETRYKCKVYNLIDGNNSIVVQVKEEGCPPASFPFDVTYTKPVARTRNKPAVKESVTITKQTKKSTNSSNMIWGI
jgi:hypothetical protein